VNVPIVNSTINRNFVSGILWDSSDSVDEEFNSTEGEDIVFITKVNKPFFMHRILLFAVLGCLAAGSGFNYLQ